MALLSKMLLVFILLFCNLSFTYCKKNKQFNETKPSSKYDNPNFIRDRYYDTIWKPMAPEEWKNRYRQPYHPAWMDYCDPYHCNDYHKIACGLNRRNMRFKWFQSGCHIILNNMCSDYRGSLKYDMVETKYCSYFVMFLRNGCPDFCPDELQPVCCISVVDRHVVLFKNTCEMNKANCNGGVLEEYEEIDQRVCQNLLQN